MRALLNVVVAIAATVSLSGCCCMPNGSCDSMSGCGPMAADCGMGCDTGCQTDCGGCNENGNPCGSADCGSCRPRLGLGLGRLRGALRGGAECNDCSVSSGHLSGVSQGATGSDCGCVGGRLGLTGAPMANGRRPLAGVTGLFSGFAGGCQNGCGTGGCDSGCGTGGVSASMGDCGAGGISLGGGMGLRGGRLAGGMMGACRDCNGGGCQSCGGGLMGRGMMGGGLGSKLHPYGGQVPHTAGNPNMGGGAAPSYAYPYYTTRGPRDFLRDNPPTIGW